MKQHWLYRTGTSRKLWILGSIVLALTIMAELFISLHSYFAIERLFSFHALLGFISCVVMIVFAKLLGVLVKRKDNYYDDV
ncbi:MAG: hypothetical protein ACE1ZG_07045 [Gammaproteobacteria bacterium]